MKDTDKRIEEQQTIVEREIEILNKMRALQVAELIKSKQGEIGKCYKCKVCYTYLDEEKTWWQYYKVVKIDERGQCFYTSIFIDYYGNVNTTKTTWITDPVEISKEEYEKTKNEIIEKIKRDF